MSATTGSTAVQRALSRDMADHVRVVWPAAAHAALQLGDGILGCACCPAGVSQPEHAQTPLDYLVRDRVGIDQEYRRRGVGLGR